MAREFLQVDPRKLRLPWSRREGTDPTKLARQIAQFGKRTDGMPPIEVARGKDGILRISNGATRATRVAKLLPGQLVDVEVSENIPNADFSRLPTVEEKLP